LNPPKSMMLPATSPVTETARRVLDNVVILSSIKLWHDPHPSPWGVTLLWIFPARTLT
jgi:hypothetical protein